MGRIVFAVAVAAALVAFAALAALPAQAAEPAIGIGEVTAQSTSRDDVDVAALRAMVEEAVGSLDVARLPRGRGAVLSVSLVRMDSRASSPAEVTCLVSATLRDRKRGSVFAVVEGTARGQDEPRRMRALERATLRAAVTSAIARVPEAMRRRRR
jgi:hypothetical protein